MDAHCLNLAWHQPHGPEVAVIECPNVHLLKSGIRALDDLPCVNIPSNARDSHYQALGWQIVAAKIGMQRCAAATQWLNERISLARYAHVPLGNFETDWLIFTADLFFSRALRDQQQKDPNCVSANVALKACSQGLVPYQSQLVWLLNHENSEGFPGVGHEKSYRDGSIRWEMVLESCGSSPSRVLEGSSKVLWISDNGIPDLGGLNEEDTCFADEVHQPVLTYPGAYRKVAVELKIHHLAVNALLKSNQVNEMEGGALFGFEQDMNMGAHGFNERCGFDEATLCAPTFRVLKQLIQRCLADAVSSGNVFADAILQHLYRWLYSPQSKLHDPALHRILHKVMQKVFALLLAEFRKLGAAIVFANFSKVIIDTGKSDLSAAKAYCDSLLKLCKLDLFEWIEIEPLHFWHSLLFMDQYNYGGVQARSHGGSLIGSSDPTSESIEDESQVDIVSSWNIAEQLPKTIQDHFVLIVSEFMYTPWKYAREQAANRASARNSDSCTPSITAAAAEVFESHITEYLKEQISSYFADKLLRIVRDTVLHMKGMNRSENDQHTGDAALEFIKHVCAVLALDQNVQHDILVMRKNLLKYVHVREFAPEAEFCDPCQSFILPNVICSYCNDCRDLDLCRDSALLAQEWRCAVPQCGQPYDDLVCLKCNQVKAAHLAEQCSCAGSFRCKEDVSEFQSKMQVFLKIAMLQKFQLLQECTSWILEIR
ncbi:DNA polymerase epsilon catalytic subunit A [Vitis vinifera]|uniref:DNA polymerase epsilon catalytic subunit n=1 Tax=Vitis vinifera TaxID=29760 RepID=A0A438F395_VITVI|nr:DNA polymerase epsilon catalytic subunit A [Vitis vinifera]